MTLPKIDKSLALQVTQFLLMVIGGVVSVEFVVSLKAFYMILASLFGAGIWTVTYKFAEGIRAKFFRRYGIMGEVQR